MTINKFQGKTKEEAIEKAKSEFGENAVIMNVKEIKPKGLFRAFKSSTFEVTAAMEEKENVVEKRTAQIPNQAPSKIENINLRADEEIVIPKYKEMPVEKKMNKSDDIEARLNNLSSILEEKLNATKPEEEQPVVSSNSHVSASKNREDLKFARVLYSTLLMNEVNEKYVNQLLNDVEKFLKPSNSVDTMLSNVYQKLVLRLGQPKTIDLSGKKPKVVFFIGPTGVGKTTTIAKIASKYKVEYGKKVAFITADTYRIAATEQLRVYANILDAPMSIVYSSQELNDAVDAFAAFDLIFVDTAGFSHKNISQREETKQLLEELSDEYSREVFLVLSATTKYNDLLSIVDTYQEISDYKLIFTKLDETDAYGNILNIKLYTSADLSYVTTGQNVPDDIEVLNTQNIVKELLKGR